MKRIALLLLDAGCCVDLANEDGLTPLLVAAKLGFNEICAALIVHGADIDEANEEHAIAHGANGL